MPHPMMSQNSKSFPFGYIRTDLADECCPSDGGRRAAEATPPGADASSPGGDRGFDYTEDSGGGCHVVRLCVKSGRGEQLVGKRAGRYVTVSTGRLWLADSEEFERAVVCVASELRDMIRRTAPQLGDGCILVAGLGNRAITADAIGPMTVDGITVTRHLKQRSPEIYDALSVGEIAAIAPGVLGQTGIESADMIRAAAECVNPGLIIAIDALAARSPERLASTVQLSDSGIAPGSGIGNRRASIDRETLGIPVIAVGVPTVVDTATLVCDALLRAGYDSLPENVEQTLGAGESLFVSLKESDAAVTAVSGLLSRAIEEALER